MSFHVDLQAAECGDPSLTDPGGRRNDRRRRRAERRAPRFRSSDRRFQRRREGDDFIGGL
jgi:hypothetical protein